MKLSEGHINNREISTKLLSPLTQSKVISIQILEDGLLKEHVTKSPAILVCVSGEVIYEDENGKKVALKPGDYQEIEPAIRHWVRGILKSQLLLIK